MLTTGRRVVVEVAMRYWQPDTDCALRALDSAGVSRVVTLTLYPHYSRATTGSSRREFDRVLSRPEWRGRFDVSHVDAYPDHPLYLDAMTDTVRRALDGFPPGRRDHVTLVFSAHGLPQKFIDEGDPYVEHTQRTVQGILHRLGGRHPYVVAFQSRTGPVKWIGPGTDDVLRELGTIGVRDVLMVPVSFVCDHIETLHEVDQLFRDDARAAGIENYRRTKALNTHPVFIAALGDLVTRQLVCASPEP